MNVFIKNGNVQKYPCSLREFIWLHPQISFPSNPEESLLNEFGFYSVKSTETPVFNKLIEKAVEVLPVFLNSEWNQKYEIIALSPNEVENIKKEIQSDIIRITQERLDTFAQSRNYDNILSACSYASSQVPKFQSEGQQCVNARDNTWAALSVILDEVQSGEREVPAGFAEIESELPVLEWSV